VTESFGDAKSAGLGAILEPGEIQARDRVDLVVQAGAEHFGQTFSTIA
jgi:hypothetical protein